MADQDVQHGIETGCAVTAQASPNMTVAVAAGAVRNANVSASVAAQNATITTADTTQDRYDLISVSNAGVVTVTAGTPADVPVQPENSDVRIAYVYVYSQASASYTGTIVSGVIQDVRKFVLIHTSPYRVSGLWYGPVSTGGKTTGPWVNNSMWLLPFFTAKTMTLQTIGMACDVAGTAGSKGRLGIYTDDGAGGLTLLVDAGQVALDVSTSEPTLSISVTLNPGWVWLAVALQSIGVTKPTLYLASIVAGLAPVGASSIATAKVGRYGAIYYTGISGALPTTPSSPDYSNTTVPPAVWVQAA